MPRPEQPGGWPASPLLLSSTAPESPLLLRAVPEKLPDKTSVKSHHQIQFQKHRAHV